jgi:hypothetical protein
LFLPLILQQPRHLFLLLLSLVLPRSFFFFEICFVETLLSLFLGN